MPLFRQNRNGSQVFTLPYKDLHFLDHFVSLICNLLNLFQPCWLSQHTPVFELLIKYFHCLEPSSLIVWPTLHLLHLFIHIILPNDEPSWMPFEYCAWASFPEYSYTPFCVLFFQLSIELISFKCIMQFALNIIQLSLMECKLYKRKDSLLYLSIYPKDFLKMPGL